MIEFSVFKLDLSELPIVYMGEEEVIDFHLNGVDGG